MEGADLVDMVMRLNLDLLEHREIIHARDVRILELEENISNLTSTIETIRLASDVVSQVDPAYP